MKLDKIREITEKITKNSFCSSELVYLLERVDREPTDKDINRTAGSPIGMPENKWPRYNSFKMEHVITLDLNEVPLIKKNLNTNSRAISVFLSSLSEFHAYEFGNDECNICLI